jgi:hypothetical protein
MKSWTMHGLDRGWSSLQPGSLRYLLGALLPLRVEKSHPYLAVLQRMQRLAFPVVDLAAPGLLELQYQPFLALQQLLSLLQ